MNDCAHVKTEDNCAFPGGEDDQKSSQNRHENEVISVTPIHLKFSFDSVLDHVAPVTLWNKTKKHVRFRIVSPQSDIFQIYCDQQDLYANSEVTLYVKCKPQNTRMYVDCLEIHVQGQPGIIRVTLELLPNVNWFVLPKYISLPLAPLSVRVEAKIRLPVARGNHAYNFCIISPVNQFFTVTPRSGTISAGGGVKFLTVSFIANEYLTLTYKLRIKFPQVDRTPYEVEIFGRCAPNVIGTAVRRDVVEIEKLTADLQQSTKNLQNKQKKKKEPTFRLVKPMDSVPPCPTLMDDVDECGAELKNILTPAGVAKFLLQKGTSSCDSSTMLGPLGVDMHKSLATYQDKKTEFMGILNKLLIHQNNLLTQHHKEFVGSDSIDSSPQLVEQIKLDRERFLNEYQKAVGMRNDDCEDLSRTKLKKFNQRQIRDAGGHHHQQEGFDINHFYDESKYQNQLKQLQRATLRPFVQAARLIITRWRTDQRLKKLRKVVAEEKQNIQKEQEKMRKEQEEKEKMVFKCPDDDECDFIRDKKFFNEMNRLRAQAKNQETKDLMDSLNTQLTQLRQRVNDDLRKIRGSIKETDLTPDTINNFNDDQLLISDESAAASKRHNDLHDQMTRLNGTIQGLENKFFGKPQPDNRFNYEEEEDVVVGDDNDKLIEMKQNEEARITKEIENLLGPDSPLHAKYKEEEQELRGQLKKVNDAIGKLQDNMLTKPLDKLQVDFNKEIHRLLGDPPSAGDFDKVQNDNLGNLATIAMTPEKLEELLDGVNGEIDKIPSKFKTHRLKSVQHGMNQLVNRMVNDLISLRDDPTGEKRLMMNQLKKINLKMDKLQTKMVGSDGEIIGRLQNQLNNELSTDSSSSTISSSSKTLSDDDGDKKIKLVQDKKLHRQSTREEIKAHLDTINKELDRLPQKYKTKKVKQIQKELSDITQKFIPEQLLSITPKLKLETDVNKFQENFSQKVGNLQQNLLADLNKVVDVVSGSENLKKTSSSGKNLMTESTSVSPPPSIKNLVSKYEGELSQLEHHASSQMQKLQEQENGMLRDEVKNKLGKIGSSIHKLLTQSSLSGDPVKAEELKQLEAELYKELGQQSGLATEAGKESRSSSWSPEQKMSLQELKKLSDIIKGEINTLPEKFKTEPVLQIQNSIGQFLSELFMDQQQGFETLKQQLSTINSAIDTLQMKIGHSPEISRLQLEFNNDLNKTLDRGYHPENENIYKLYKKSFDHNNKQPGQKMDDHHQLLQNIQNQINQAVGQLPDKLQKIQSVLNLQDKINSTINQIINNESDNNRKNDDPSFIGPEINDPRHRDKKEDLKEKLQKINTEVDKFHDNIYHLPPNTTNNNNIVKLQQQFNDQFNRLLLLPDAEGFLLKSNKKPINKVPQKPTGKELKNLQSNVNTAFSQLPDQLKTETSVQNLQESINSVIDKLIANFDDHGGDLVLHINDPSNNDEKMELIDMLQKINSEIDKLQEKIRNFEIGQAQDHFNADFNQLLFLPNEFYEGLGPTRPNYVIRKSMDGQQPPPLISQSVKPTELKIFKQNINTAINKLTEKFMTPTTKNLRDTVNTVVDKFTDSINEKLIDEDTLENQQQPRKPLENQLDRLNLVMDELRSKLAHNGEIGGLQKELNQAIKNLLGLDGNEEEEEQDELKRSSKKEKDNLTGEPLTLEQLQQYLQRINEEFDQIPEEYRTEALKIIQLRIQNAIKNLQTKISTRSNNQHRVSSVDMAPIIDLNLQIQEEHAQFRPLRKKLNDEIDEIQQKIVSSDLWRLQEELNLEFDFILSSRKGGWDVISMKWRPKRLPWTGTLPKKPKIELKELHSHASRISRAFNDIPDRFKTEQVDIIKKKIRKLLHKLTEQLDLDRDRKYLRQQQTKINEAIDSLQEKIMDRDINKFHRQLSDEILRLIDLRDDDDDDYDDDSLIDNEIFNKRRSFSGSTGDEKDEKEEKKLTLQELKYHSENINLEINQIPTKFKTEVITTAQRAINQVLHQFRKRIEEKNAKSPEGKLLNEIHRVDEQYHDQVKSLKSRLIDTVNRMDPVKMSPCDVDREKETYDELVNRLGEQIKYELDRLQLKLKGEREIENKFGIFDTIRQKFQTANSNTVKLKDMVKSLTHHLKEKIQSQATNDKIQQRLKLKLLEDKRSANGWVISGYKSRPGRKISSKLSSKVQSRHHHHHHSLSASRGASKRQSFAKGINKGSGKRRNDNYLNTIKSSKSVLSPFVTEPGSLSKLLAKEQQKKMIQGEGEAHQNSVCAFKLSDAAADKLIEELKKK